MEKGKVVAKSPKLIALKVGETKAWCSCGRSDKGTWCNGAHKGSSFSPIVFKAEEDKTYAICLCKQSKNAPYCDGSHSRA